jgi:hypothetical protein
MRQVKTKRQGNLINENNIVCIYQLERESERESSAYTGNRLNLKKKEREIGNVLSNDVTLVSL